MLRNGGLGNFQDAGQRPHAQITSKKKPDYLKTGIIAQGPEYFHYLAIFQGIVI